MKTTNSKNEMMTTVNAQRSVDVLTTIKWAVSFLAELNASEILTGVDPTSVSIKSQAEVLQAVLFTKVRQLEGF